MPNQEVGSAYVSVYPKMSKDWSNVGSEAASSFSNGISTKSVALGTALGGIIGKAASAAGELLMANLERGIERSDMLNSFPKMMEQLGYGSDVAEGSIKKIMDHLRGLPTATQDLLPFVQTLTAMNHDLELSTDLGLAFNDMLVASGASSADASRAMEMLSKMLASGTYNSQRWTSIIETMPLQMGLLAEEMLGAGATAQQLGDALQDGTVSFDDLTEAMIRLDKEGGESFASFDEQAHTASGGIMTSVDNLSNRIATGWQEIIDAIGNEEISGAINALGDAFSETMGRISESIKWFKELVAQLPPPVREALDAIIEDFNVFDTSMNVITGGAWSNVVKTVGDKATLMAQTVDVGTTSMAASMSSSLSNIKASTSSTWPFVANSVSSSMSSASGSASSGASGILSSVDRAWKDVSSTTSSEWSNVPSTINSKMGEAERVVSGSISDIVSRFNGLGGRVSSAIGTIHFPVPKISTEYLTVGNTSIPIPRVSWNALGGYYDEPSIIGVGEAGGELVLPQSGGIMDPFAETVAQKVGRNDADKVIAWLDDNLPYIIEHFTPTIGERDFNRLARRAYA